MKTLTEPTKVTTKEQFLAKHTAKGLQIIGGREAELFSGKRTSQRFGR